MRRKRNAFSLVELLVVLAVVSVLAAFLLPTLEKTLDEALKASCASRLRQQYMCLSAYATDWKGYFPESPPDGQQNAWFQSNVTGEWRGGFWQLRALGYMSTTELYLCPGLEANARSSPATLFPYINTETIGTWLPYGVSGYTYFADKQVRWWLTYYTASRRVLLRQGTDTVYAPWGINRTWNRLAIASCPMHTLEGFTSGAPFGTVEALVATGQWKWAHTGHKPGDPQGTNILTGDGRMRWLGMRPGLFSVNRGSGLMVGFGSDSALPYQ